MQFYVRLMDKQTNKRKTFFKGSGTFRNTIWPKGRKRQPPPSAALGDSPPALPPTGTPQDFSSVVFIKMRSFCMSDFTTRFSHLMAPETSQGRAGQKCGGAGDRVQGCCFLQLLAGSSGSWALRGARAWLLKSGHPRGARAVLAAGAGGGAGDPLAPRLRIAI